jgi:endonuclease/exonuclease/phosphatase family metal-dependent hydrolase
MRILTLNIWKNDGDFPARLAELPKAMLALNPDVIVLQEVYQDETMDVGADLATRCGFQSCHAIARVKMRGDQVSSSGLAILSRWPIASSLRLDLPSSDADGGRAALQANIHTADGVIRIVNLHLSHLAGAQGDALRQSQWAFVQSQARNGFAGPIIWAGDFNARPDTDWLLAQISQSILHCSGAHLTGQTSLRDRPDALIDHIIVAGAGQLDMASAAICLDIGPAFSDHFGVLAKLNRLSNLGMHT